MSRCCSVCFSSFAQHTCQAPIAPHVALPALPLFHYGIKRQLLQPLPASQNGPVTNLRKCSNLPLSEGYDGSGN